MKLTIEQERQITAQYQYIKELATLKYDAEEKREQNLIQQSSQMQTAFSFMTAAVFAATAICIEYRGKADLEFFSDSSICCCFFADCESTFSILSAMEMENRSISRYTGYEGYGCK